MSALEGRTDVLREPGTSVYDPDIGQCAKAKYANRKV